MSKKAGNNGAAGGPKPRASAKPNVPPTPKALAVLKDGVVVPEEEARALWVRFSTHMDEHVGDMAGFARLNGWFSVLPEYRNGQAVLIVCTVQGAPTREPREPGANAKKKPNAPKQR